MMLVSFNFEILDRFLWNFVLALFCHNYSFLVYCSRLWHDYGTAVVPSFDVRTRSHVMWLVVEEYSYICQAFKFYFVGRKNGVVDTREIVIELCLTT